MLRNKDTNSFYSDTKRVYYLIITEGKVRSHEYFSEYGVAIVLCKNFQNS